MTYTMQPIIKDDKGIHRFEENPIIGYMASELTDLNHLSRWCSENDIPQKYQEQLAQLIGYSVSGYGTLSYVSDESYDLATKAEAGLATPQWVPEVGEEVIVNYAGDDVVGFILAHHGDTPIVAFVPKGYEHYQYEPADRTDIRKLPIEEDRAVEEMVEIVTSCKEQSVEARLRHLWRQGYRKQPQPAEDMSDPANWRAGDKIVCIEGCSWWTKDRTYTVVEFENNLVVFDDSVDYRQILNPIFKTKFRHYKRP